MKAESFECPCGHKLTGRKITLDSKDMLVCPKCKRTHYIDAEFVDWKKSERREMEIGLYDVDSHKFPNIALMKLSAWHKVQGDNVEFIVPFKRYNKIYVSKVFGDEYSRMSDFCLQADEIVYGGTGFAITVENGKEVYHKDRDPNLPYEIEHMYPDYSLYPELTKGKAYGFLTRGCCNNCDFCIVSKKEGMCSKKIADLSEFWDGQKEIVLLDANILACKDRMGLKRPMRNRS